MLDDIKYTKFLLVNSMNFFTYFYHTVAISVFTVIEPLVNKSDTDRLR